MSTIDTDEPISAKRKIEDFKEHFNFDNEKKQYFGYIAYRCKENNIRIKKIFIEEIIVVRSSQNNEILNTLCSVSYFKKQKRLFRKPIEVKIYLNKEVYENFYSSYSPFDKIYLEDIFKNEKCALTNYKRQPVYKQEKYDNLFD